MANKPVHTFTAGTIKVAIWRNETRDGKPFFTYALSRLYKPEPDAQWRSAATFGLRDMSKLLAAVVHADEWIRQQLREEGQLVPTDSSTDDTEGA